MKKTMLYFAALACCLFTLTACGDDEPDTTATGTYTITFGTDFFKGAEFAIIYYKGVNGESKREIMNAGTTWTKTINTKVPAELAYKIEIEPRESVADELETYDISLTGAISGAISSGGTGSFSNSTSFISGRVAKDKVISTLNSNKVKSYGYRMDKDGNASQYTPSF